jgi:hypothetical protein
VLALAAALAALGALVAWLVVENRPQRQSSDVTLP